MKIVTANGKQKVVMTRKEWESIGKKAGWSDAGDTDVTLNDQAGQKDSTGNMDITLNDESSKTNDETPKTSAGYVGKYDVADTLFYKSLAPFLKKGDVFEVVQATKNSVRYRNSLSPTVFKLPIDQFKKWLSEGKLKKR
jgi:hypothetical protein